MQNLLIIEDEKDIADIYTIWFDKKYQITACYDGLEGLNQIVTQKNLNNILLDLNIPYRNGMDVMEQINSLLLCPDNIKIIVCSGFIPKEFQEKFQAKKNVHFLNKPVLIGDIEKALAA